MKLAKTTLAALAALACAHADAADVITWRGGSSAAVASTSNWDPSEGPNRRIAAITNSVTFTDANSTYWYPIAVNVTNNINVKHSARIMPEANYIPDGEYVWDIGAGGKFESAYIFYGIPEATLVKKGSGFLKVMWVGTQSEANHFGNVDVREGMLGVYYDTTSGDRVNVAGSIRVRSGATFDTTMPGCVCTMFAPTFVVDAGGLVNFHDKSQRIPGLEGDGVITNGWGGLTFTCINSAKVFSGKIHGKVIVKPSTSAAPGSYCVIGAADTLADATLEIKDVAGYDNPIRFAAGIGTFYVRDFPDRKFYDVEGNEVTLRRSHVWYVDASRTEAQGEGDGTTEATAFRTLKAALENPGLSAYDTVCALPGMYTNGVMGTGYTRMRATVPANVYLVSRDGADTTFIVGKDSPTPTASCYGCGSNAVRCVYLNSGARVVGFTLTGGRVYCSATSSGHTGGAVEAADTSSLIVDCVMSNNVAYRGGAGHLGTYVRCRAYKNRATQIGSVWYERCDLYDCVSDNNLNYSYYLAGNAAKLYNCTFGPNDSGGNVRALGTTDDKKAHFYHCVFLSAQVDPNQGKGAESCSVFHRCILANGLDSEYKAEDGCIITNISAVADRLAFAGLGADLRPLSAASIAVDAGNDQYYTGEPANIAHPQTDLDGNARIQGRTIEIGAYEHDWHVDAALIKAADRGLAVDGAVVGANPVAAGETLTFTISRAIDSVQLCTGFTTNGVFVSFDDFPSGWSYTVDGDDPNTAIVIEAVYVRPTTWYVDAVNGSDANPGYLPTCPKKTLADVTTNTAVTSGHVIWAEPGWYSNGVVYAEEQNNRVKVPNGVTLQSTGGPDVTFIVGEKSPNPVTDAIGCGPGAVRCVLLGNASSVLSGFTLTNGYTTCARKDAGKLGGGVCGNTGSFPGRGRVINCIFRNCVAIRGGGANGTKCINCRFYKNATPYIGVAANFCELVNCLFSGHTTGSYVTLNCFYVRNCTFLDDNSVGIATHYSSTPVTGGEKYTVTNVCNSLILCSQTQQACYTRCVFSTDASTKVTDAQMGEGSVKMAKSQMGLDSEGRPTSKDSVLVDRGDNDLYWMATFTPGDEDLEDGQRIYNANIDIGCYEFDWRELFARALGGPHSLGVSAASPPVTTNAAGGLLLPGDGAALAAAWTNKAPHHAEYSFAAQVSGDATLLVYRDGADEPWATINAADGAKTLSFSSNAATNTLSFLLSGDGAAVLGDFSKRTGAMLIIR